MPARLLTPSQYNNTLLDLLKVSGDLAKEFGGAVDGHLDDLSVERRANAAALAARQAATGLAQWSPCTPPAVEAAACQAQIIDRIGTRAYRRPLTAAEKTELGALFDAGVKEKDFATGVEWFLTGLLQSPDFLYQVARPQASEVAGQVRPLAAHELASRLAYFIWDSPPDDALFEAATQNALSDPAMLATTVDRLLQDPRARRGLAGFYGSWLRLAAFNEAARDDAAFTTEVVAALRTSLLMSATELYSGSSPNITGLFSGQSYYLNGALKRFYGKGGAAADPFAMTELPGEDRYGVLTHPALMALLARPAESNPISRGLFVRHVLFCQEIPPPPSTIVIPQLAPIAPNLSTRDRLAQHTKEALCATCHSLIDPPGFALEGFDQVGRFRAMEGGKPVDTSGMMADAGDLEGRFAKGADFLGRLRDSRLIRECFAQQYFEYAASRHGAPEDACTLDGLKSRFVPSGDLRGLVSAIALSDGFRFRKSEGAAP